MIKIVAYKSSYQDGIDKMMKKIASEFDEPIFPKVTIKKPCIPDKYWVAINNEEIIGTVGIITLENDFGVLKNMMVKKEYRGKAFGISKLLLETAIHWLNENRISKLYLGTMHQFKVAQSFYEKNEFNRILEDQLPYNFSKNPLDKVFYVKYLNI